MFEMEKMNPRISKLSHTLKQNLFLLYSGRLNAMRYKSRVYAGDGINEWTSEWVNDFIGAVFTSKAFFFFIAYNNSSTANQPTDPPILNAFICTRSDNVRIINDGCDYNYGPLWAYLWL